MIIQFHACCSAQFNDQRVNQLKYANSFCHAKRGQQIRVQRAATTGLYYAYKQEYLSPYIKGNLYLIGLHAEVSDLHTFNC